MTEPVSGKVARVMNSRELVINRGSSEGVEVGMRFAVLERSGGAIKDPDTGEELGYVQRPKVQVEVTQVGERMSVAKTYRTHTVNVGGVSALGYQLGEIGRMFAPPQYVERVETLKASDADWEPLTEAQSLVKVGDPIVQIDVDDEDEIGGILSSSTREILQTGLEGPAQQDSN
jgi:hypothetical protein